MSIDISKLKTYPLSETELKPIVDVLKQTYDQAAHRVKQMQQLTPKEQNWIDNFLFYYNMLLQSNVSPIGVGFFSLKRRYTIDAGEFIGWHCIDDIQRIPVYEGNNFYTLFVKDYYAFKEHEEGKLDSWLLSHVEKENRKLLEERVRTQQLLRGDSLFGRTMFSRYLHPLSPVQKPTEEEIKRMRKELDERNILAYIDWQGKEVRVRKTPFEVWEEFKKENSQLTQKLIEMCNLPSKELGRRTDELFPLSSRAFTLMRIKGFDTYPLHR